MAAPPITRSAFPWLPRVILLPLVFLGIIFLAHLRLHGRSSPLNFSSTDLRCDPSIGRWIKGRRNVFYNESCPFHRNAWNCLKNGREEMGAINSWIWVPHSCGSEVVKPLEDGFDPAAFLSAFKGRRIGFIGDSLNENFVVSFLCTLRSVDNGAKKWKKKKGVWRGGYFPLFDVTVAYHRAVLLSRYQ